MVLPHDIPGTNINQHDRLTSRVPRLILNIVIVMNQKACISSSWVSYSQDWTLAVNLLLSWDDQKTISAADMEEFLSKFLEAFFGV